MSRLVEHELPRWFLLLPLGAQAGLLTVDEFVFHRRRGLATWERWGHPIDTSCFVACLVVLLLMDVARSKTFFVYLALATLSTLIITKDEFVHHEACQATEQWLHSLLFVLHPVCLFCFWQLAVAGEYKLILFNSVAVATFMVYQLIYWNIIYVQKVRHQ